MPDLPEGGTVIVQPAQIDRVVQSARQPSGEPPADEPKRRKGRMVAALLLIAALAGGGAFAFLQTQSEEDPVATPAITTTTTSQATTTTEPPATTAKPPVTTTRPRVTTTTLAPAITTTPEVSGSSAPKAMVPSLSAGLGEITARWSRVDGARSYQIQLQGSNDRDIRSITEELQYTFEGLAAINYRALLRAKGDGLWGPWSPATGWVRGRPPAYSTTTTLPTAFLAERAVLTDTYQWGYSEQAKTLQNLLGLTKDGNYGEGTRTAHMAVLRDRGLSTWRVPSPPPTTTTTTTTTVVTYTHPSKMAALTAGTPYLSGNEYRVSVSWSRPAQSGSSSVKEYEISSPGRSWTASGTTTSSTLTLGTDRSGRFLKIRACNYENRCGGWSNEKYLSVNTFPTTTTIATPRYKLHEFENRNERWDPCEGAVSIKLNPNGYLTSTELGKWEPMLAVLAADISSFTGLNVVYSGTTSIPLRMEHPSARTSVDLLIFIGPLGTGHMADLPLDTNYFGDTHFYVDTYNTAIWVEMDAFDVQIAYRDDRELADVLTHRKKYLMNFLGRAFGLASPGDDIDTEIMSWGGTGSGTRNNPDWGEGDKIAFGLVGANNGCIN